MPSTPTNMIETVKHIIRERSQTRNIFLEGFNGYSVWNPKWSLLILCRYTQNAIFFFLPFFLKGRNHTRRNKSTVRCRVDASVRLALRAEVRLVSVGLSVRLQWVECVNSHSHALYGLKGSSLALPHFYRFVSRLDVECPNFEINYGFRLSWISRKWSKKNH